MLTTVTASTRMVQWFENVIIGNDGKPILSATGTVNLLVDLGTESY